MDKPTNKKQLASVIRQRPLCPPAFYAPVNNSWIQITPPVGIHYIIFSLLSDAWESCADRNKNVGIRWNGKPFQSWERWID